MQVQCGRHSDSQDLVRQASRLSKDNRQDACPTREDELLDGSA